jgi:hypothetical protein
VKRPSVTFNRVCRYLPKLWALRVSTESSPQPLHRQLQPPPSGASGPRPSARCGSDHCLQGRSRMPVLLRELSRANDLGTPHTRDMTGASCPHHADAVRIEDHKSRKNGNLDAMRWIEPRPGWLSGKLFRATVRWRARRNPPCRHRFHPCCAGTRSRFDSGLLISLLVHTYRRASR